MLAAVIHTWEWREFAMIDNEPITLAKAREALAISKRELQKQLEAQNIQDDFVIGARDYFLSLWPGLCDAMNEALFDGETDWGIYADAVWFRHDVSQFINILDNMANTYRWD
jgi:hypothetical protein